MIQRAAGDPVHDGIDILTHLNKIVHLRQSGMVKIFQHIRLGPGIVGAVQPFDDYLFVQPEMPAGVDDTGAALADFFPDLVDAVQNLSACKHL